MRFKKKKVTFTQSPSLHLPVTILTKHSQRFSGIYLLVYKWGFWHTVILCTVSSHLGLFQRFSNCSKASVSRTLRVKAPQCFKVRTSNLCGNSRVEEGEECDSGLLHRNDDPCCTADCKLKKGKQCRCVVRKSRLIWQLQINLVKLGDFEETWIVFDDCKGRGGWCKKKKKRFWCMVSRCVVLLTNCQQYSRVAF